MIHITTISLFFHGIVWTTGEELVLLIIMSENAPALVFFYVDSNNNQLGKEAHLI